MSTSRAPKLRRTLCRALPALIAGLCLGACGDASDADFASEELLAHGEAAHVQEGPRVADPAEAAQAPTLEECRSNAQVAFDQCNARTREPAGWDLCSHQVSNAMRLCGEGLRTGAVRVDP